MIKVSNLTKKYGSNYAIRDVSFQVEQGEIVGFLGPNGAGKTTTMNIITGYISSTEGSVEVDGYDILEQPDMAKQRMGYLPEQPPLYIDMTVNEYLDFIFELKRCKLEKEPHLDEVCALTGIEKVRTRLIRNLSKGYRQRVGIAQALVNNPPVLILDEPTVGLDPSQIVEIRSLIQTLSKRHTVILSSHILSEVQAVCSRVIVLNRGRLIANSTTDSLSRTFGSGATLTIEVAGPEKGTRDLLCSIRGVRNVQALGEKERGVHEYRVTSDPQRDVRRDIFDALAKRGWPILALRPSEMSLEDIFLSLTHEN